MERAHRRRPMIQITAEESKKHVEVAMSRRNDSDEEDDNQSRIRDRYQDSNMASQRVEENKCDIEMKVSDSSE